MQRLSGEKGDKLIVIEGILRVPIAGSIPLFVLGMAIYLYAIASLGILLATVAIGTDIVHMHPAADGAAIMARMIERQVGKRWVPVLPWTIIAQLLKILPASVLAPRQKRN